MACPDKVTKVKRLIQLLMICAFANVFAQDKAPEMKAQEKVSERKPLTAYFEQAQQRANHAHEALMASQRKLKQALRAERAAADDLSQAQRKFDEAKRRADAAAEASRAAQAEEMAAQERWSKEAAALRDAHREMEAGQTGK